MSGGADDHPAELEGEFSGIGGVVVTGLGHGIENELVVDGGAGIELLKRFDNFGGAEKVGGLVDGFGGTVPVGKLADDLGDKFGWFHIFGN